MNAGTLVRRPGLARLLGGASGRARGIRDGGRGGGSGRRWRPSRRLIVLLVVLLAGVIGGGYMWVRHSSLVAVRKVTVVGLSGKDARRIRRALIAAAKTMTTLDVNMAALRTAVAPYSEIKAIHVTTEFPHGVRIDVVEDYPLAMVSSGGQQVAVAPDGTLLHDVSASGTLPTIPVGVPPGGNRLTARGALDALAVLAAAPYQFIPRISQASEDSAHGVVIQLRSGPVVYFGDTSALGAKWHALVLVLADPGSGGATYIDVSDPKRPAAGGGAAAAEAAIAAGLAQTGTSTTSSQTLPGGTSTGTSTGASTATSIGSATTQAPATPTATGTPTGTAPPPATTGPTATSPAPTGTSTTGGGGI